MHESRLHSLPLLFFVVAAAAAAVAVAVGTFRQQKKNFTLNSISIFCGKNNALHLPRFKSSLVEFDRVQLYHLDKLRR